MSLPFLKLFLIRKLSHSTYPVIICLDLLVSGSCTIPSSALVTKSGPTDVVSLVMSWIGLVSSSGTSMFIGSVIYTLSFGHSRLVRFYTIFSSISLALLWRLSYIPLFRVFGRLIRILRFSQETDRPCSHFPWIIFIVPYEMTSSSVATAISPSLPSLLLLVPIPLLPPLLPLLLLPLLFETLEKRMFPFCALYVKKTFIHGNPFYSSSPHLLTRLSKLPH